MSTTEVLCPPCMVCGQATMMTVDRDAYDRWKAGEYLQVAFPAMSADDREVLLTGTHGPCWNSMFSEDEK